jgi:ribosomal protein S18 acetylase RimI-like enzyme
LCGHDGLLGFIHHTCVNSDYRNKGVGKQLVSIAVAALKRYGISLVSLVVYKHNEQSEKFWEDLGFIAPHDLTYRNKRLFGETKIVTM